MIQHIGDVYSCVRTFVNLSINAYEKKHYSFEHDELYLGIFIFIQGRFTVFYGFRTVQIQFLTVRSSSRQLYFLLVLAVDLGYSLVLLRARIVQRNRDRFSFLRISWDDCRLGGWQHLRNALKRMPNLNQSPFLTGLSPLINAYSHSM